MVGWLLGGWLLAVGWCVFVETDHGEHFAGFGVHEEVLHEDLWSGGVRGAVLVVVVFFDVVLSPSLLGEGDKFLKELLKLL